MDKKTACKCHKYLDYKDKIKFPAITQLKIDGMRGIATVKDGVCVLTSSTGKPITGVPHINAELASLDDCVLDGELYVHLMPLQEIVSRCRRQLENLHEDHQSIKYETFETLEGEPSVVRLLHTNRIADVKVNSHEEIETLLSAALELGYEGLVIRTQDYKFQWGKRLNTILKYKPTIDAEFLIVGFTEGKGKWKNALGSLTCECNGQTFNAALKAPENYKREIWKDRDSLIGKFATVKHLRAMTSGGLPREPIALIVRDYE